MRTLATVWDERYCTAAARSVNSTTKQADVVAMAVSVLDVRPTTFDEEATWRDVAKVHLPSYAQAVRTGFPRSLAESQGFTWSPAFATALARIWAGQYAAAEIALAEGGFVFHPVSGAHHAGIGSGGGFCTLNFLAGAALRLIREGRVERVGIIDLDAHQGNGTFEWVRGEARLAHFDISGSSWGVDVTPKWATYRVAHNARQYDTALRELDAWLDDVRPSVVFYQAGADCWQYDHVGGITGVDRAFLARRDMRVLSALMVRNIPTVINLGGGYSGVAATLHAQTAVIAARLLNGDATLIEVEPDADPTVPIWRPRQREDLAWRPRHRHNDRDRRHAPRWGGGSWRVGPR